MTKESAIVLFATIGLYELILFMMSSTKNYIAFFKKCIIVVSPISVWLIFLVWQKQVNGWYFFPEHTGYISFDLSAIWNKTERYFSYLVFFQGRNSITVIMIVPIWFFIRNKKYSLENPMHRMLGLFSLFAVLFILFSSLNFYSDRYMLCTLPGFIISAVVVIEGYYKRLLLVVAFAAVAVGTYTSLYKKSISDHNLGYVEAVHVYQEAVNYMVANKLKKEPIYAYFLMKENLTNPYTGYVSKENAFLSVSDSYHPKVSRYFIASNTEGQEEFKKLKETVPMTLVKRFEKNHVWVALYKAVE